MTNTETHKAIKINPGVYSYRGYTIHKDGGHNVNAGVGEYGWNGNVSWKVSTDDGSIHIGFSSYNTLKAAKAGIDNSIKAVAAGAVIINR